jgi:hypothetical protein
MSLDKFPAMVARTLIVAGRYQEEEKRDEKGTF